LFDFSLFGSPHARPLELAFWGIPILVGVLLLAKLLRAKLRGARGERKVGRALEGLFDEVLHDIIIPDGRGGLTQLDHVALTGAGLLVVEAKNYSGAIFGREEDAQWTQRLGGRSYRFQNPLRQNHLHVSALQALPLGVPVRGQVVFTDDASFPNGLPKGVSHLKDIRRDLADLADGTEVPSDYAIPWGRLKATARTDKDARKAHLAGVRQKKGGGFRPQTAAMLLVLFTTWIAVMWMRFAPSTTQPAPQVTREPPAPTIARSVPRSDPRRDQAPPPPPQPRSVASPPGIAWSHGKSTTSEECRLATAAVLVDNSAENREYRDRICGKDRPGPD
jgi:hypothetical protein